ncbi:tRNA pseudouridine(13) synthase TruD [Caminibacter pacificus]|uniref:tRNA pseudouridine synthase D n=1 Tax=Caminibacter pacificus TaxID=1424653 RepID=A0AAJ4RC33_9BACT|nr:tRNA pseudouridine(13) synthase TruD [Caminibacter pacificus]QCI27979.1 tRNA pseudouridine(13) synthase TruD [Caminibacter pacificus]ROR39835.1 tRNA pseudouridine13 synthase [Caminibacter pacificus]
MIYSHAPINFHFNKNSENFVVEEIPLYPFAHTGEWLMLKVRKKGLTTDEMLKRISSATGIKLKEMGYAGLKDKEGMTIQWISVPRKYRDEINKFQDKQIKIVEQDLHRNKLKIGHLKGNKFFVRLKKVLPVDAKKLDNVLKEIKKYGIPNFFGYQRFGKFGNNWEEGKAIIEGDKFVKNRKLEKFLISAYQSKLFNDWLNERIKLSNIFDLSEKELQFAGYDKELIKFVKAQKHPFKLLPGDVMSHYPVGKFFYLENVEDTERFLNKDITVTGLLPGKKALRAKDKAREIEEKYDELIPAKGDRRAAWIFPEILEKNYLKDYAQYEIVFTLPKGSYATVLIDILKNGIKLS